MSTAFLTLKKSARWVCLAPIVFSTAVLCSTVQSYCFWSSWGINSIYFAKFFVAAFSEFSPSQCDTWIDVPSNYEILQDLSCDRVAALCVLEACLKEWALDSHRQMSGNSYLFAMMGRVHLCLIFVTFSTFSDWIEIIFIKLQPLTPWSLLYEVHRGQLYTVDNLDYSTFIRRGGQLFSKLMADKDALSYLEKDQLAEFLIFLAADLSTTANGQQLLNLLADTYTNTTCF